MFVASKYFNGRARLNEKYALEALHMSQKRKALVILSSMYSTYFMLLLFKMRLGYHCLHGVDDTRTEQGLDPWGLSPGNIYYTFLCLLIES